MEILERLSEPTPPFWKKVLRIAKWVVGVSGAILVSPVALPTGLVTVAGYVAVAGTVAGIGAKSTSTMR